MFDLNCDGDSGLFVAPVPESGPVERSDWIEISTERADSFPVWGPGGDRIYFLGRREGSLDIWMQRIDRTSFRPVDAPQVLQRFPHARYSLDLMSDSDRRLSIGGDRLYFPLSEAGGSVWLMKPVKDEQHHEAGP